RDWTFLSWGANPKNVRAAVTLPAARSTRARSRLSMLPRNAFLRHETTKEIYDARSIALCHRVIKQGLPDTARQGIFPLQPNQKSRRLVDLLPRDPLAFERQIQILFRLASEPIAQLRILFFELLKMRRH